MTPGRSASLLPAMVTLMYILLCLIWGSTWMAIKLGLAEAPPFATAAVRFALASSVLFGISFFRRYRYPQSVPAWLRLGYPGLYMYGISYALVYSGQQYINSATSAVLFASFPFFIAVFSWLLYRTEKLNGAAWSGMLLGFAGVVLISYDSLLVSGQSFLGAVAVVTASASAAYGIIMHKRNFSETNIVVAANVQMICGGLLLVAGALLFEDWHDFNLTAVSVGSIIYLALFGTVVTFTGYYWLLKRARIVVVSLIAFITPLVAILIGVVLADEALTRLVIIGAGMTLVGVFLVVRNR